MAGERLRRQGVSERLLGEAAAYRARYGGCEGCPRIVYRGRETMEAAIAALLAGENLLLVGEKATGKNVLADTLAALFGRPSFDISFHIDVDAATLIGTDTFVEGAVRFRKGPVFLAAETGGFAVLDEVNMARGEALAVLHAVLDYRRRIEVPGYGGLAVHEATRFIATMNHGYAGTRELNEALASRFVILVMPKPAEAELAAILREEEPALSEAAACLFAGLFRELSEKAEAGEISSRAVDFRGLLDAVRLMREGIGAETAVRMGLVNKCFEPDERALVEDVVALTLPEGYAPFG